MRKTAKEGAWQFCHGLPSGTHSALRVQAHRVAVNRYHGGSPAPHRYRVRPPPDPVPALKELLGAELARLLTGWRATDVAFRLGTDAPRISDLRRGRLERFSLETLIRFTARLERRVQLTVTAERRGPAS